MSRALARGGFRWFAHSLAGVVCRGHAQYPAFPPSSSVVAVGCFWMVFGVLSIICPNCIHAAIFSPSSLFILLLEETVQVQAL